MLPFLGDGDTQVLPWWDSELPRALKGGGDHLVLDINAAWLIHESIKRGHFISSIPLSDEQASRTVLFVRDNTGRSVKIGSEKEATFLLASFDKLHVKYGLYVSSFPESHKIDAVVRCIREVAKLRTARRQKILSSFFRGWVI